MLTKKILSFFSTQGITSMIEDELHDIRPYQNGDNRHSINWKKTGKYDKLMTNIYEPDIHIHGTIIHVISDNRNKGYTQTTTKEMNVLTEQLISSITHDQQSFIKTVTLSTPPSTKNYTTNKVIVISDFFWDKKQLHHFLQACQRGEAHGIILPLLTPFGLYQHPIVSQYPKYFWEM